MASTLSMSTRKKRRSVAAACDEFSEQHSVTVDRICKVWDKLGLTEVEQAHRMKQFYSHLMGLLNEMTDEVEGQLAQLQQNVARYEQKIRKLEDELGVVEPFPLPRDANIREYEYALKNERDRLMHIRTTRVQTTNDLDAMQKDLCEWLGKQPVEVNHETVPSPETVQLLQAYVEELVNEKEGRLRTYHELRTDITQILQKMKKQPDSEFLVELARSSVEQFDFSERNMHLLTETHKQIRGEYELHLSEMTQKIDEMKGQLQEWWEKCAISDQEIQGLSFVGEEDGYSEQAFEIYASELERLQQHYAARKELYDLYHHWNEMWQEKVVFEMKPRQSYGDRGGALQTRLKRQRHNDQALPRVAQSIISLTSKWDATHPDNRFLLRGMTPDVYFEEKQNELRRKKEMAKKKGQRGAGQKGASALSVAAGCSSPKSRTYNLKQTVSTPNTVRQYGPAVASPVKAYILGRNQASPAKSVQSVHRPAAAAKRAASPLRSPRKGIQQWVQRKPPKAQAAAIVAPTPRSRPVPILLDENDQLDPLPESYENFKTPIHTNTHMRSSVAEQEFDYSPSKRPRQQ